MTSQIDLIESTLLNWKNSQMKSIPVGGLFSRNSVVYKHKAPLRSWMLRETVSWRLQDLLEQSLILYKQEYGLGPRVLLRSGIETLAVLIYLNQMIEQVLNDELSFDDFSNKTTKLVLGSRNVSTNHKSINILTILEKMNNEYDGIKKIYADLSEDVHPNSSGLIRGYSKINHEEYEICFSNRWMEIYKNKHLSGIILCHEIFDYQYNHEWTSLMEKLEQWIELNDSSICKEC